MAAHNNKRQPVSVPRPHGYLTHRDAIWAAIRQLRDGITTHDIQHLCGVNKDTIADYVHGLNAAGYLVVTGQQELTAKTGQGAPHNICACTLYRLTTDVGVHAPMINKHGHQVATGQGSRALWSAMRVLGDFNVADLLAHTNTGELSVAESSVKSYLKHLNRAGYLAMRRQRGRGGARYRLVRNTGPMPPMIQRSKAIFDPNLRDVVWQLPDGHALDVPAAMIVGGAA